MEPILKAKWRKLDGTRIEVPIHDAVKAALIHEQSLGNQIKVCIGTDSQVRGAETEFQQGLNGQSAQTKSAE